MESLILFLVVGWAFERAHMIISAPNYESVYNGYGAIDSVNDRSAAAPMAYRVLFPLLVRALERTGARRIAIYQGLKVIFSVLTFWSIAQAFGTGPALLSAIILLLTVRFDYWDWMPELIGVCLCLTGRIELAIPGAALAILSKETAWICPLAFVLGGGEGVLAIPLAALVAGIGFAVRFYVGKRPMYCPRWQLPYNLGLFYQFRERSFWSWGQWFHQDVFIACALTLLGLAAAWKAGPAGLVAVAFLGAGWTMAKADETRVFGPAIPFIAAMILGR